MPRTSNLAPDGRTFYVADMASGGVWLIDPRCWRKLRFQPTGKDRSLPGRGAWTPHSASRAASSSARADNAGDPPGPPAALDGRRNVDDLRGNWRPSRRPMVVHHSSGPPGKKCAGHGTTRAI